jgi:hypothetical protein
LLNESETVTQTAETINTLLKLRFFLQGNAQATAFLHHNSASFNKAKHRLIEHPIAIDAQYQGLNQKFCKVHLNIVGWKPAQKGRNITEYVKVDLN